MGGFNPTLQVADEATVERMKRSDDGAFIMRLSNLLDSLSRLPGLGFLQSMRSQVDQITAQKQYMVGQGKDLRDDLTDAKNAVKDVQPSKKEAA